MPFSVQSSSSVVIAATDITDDDFLKVILVNGEILYLRHDSRRLFFIFDEEFRPQSLIEQTEAIVQDRLDYWYQWPGSTPLLQLRADFKRRKGPDRHRTMKVWLARQLQETVNCVWSHQVDHNYDGYINIGRTLVAEIWWLDYEGEIRNTSYYHSRNPLWYSSDKVAAIIPTTREAIRAERVYN